MKKIFLIPVLLLTFISCSKSANDENIVNSTPKELLGTWKFTGYYDDNGNEPNGSNFHPYTTDSFQVTFNDNNTFFIRF